MTTPHNPSKQVDITCHNHIKMGHIRENCIDKRRVIGYYKQIM